MFIQNCAVVPKYVPNRIAVSAVVVGRRQMTERIGDEVLSVCGRAF